MEIIEVLIAVKHLIRLPVLYQTYASLLKDTCFKVPRDGIYQGDNYEELPLLYLWQALKRYYQEQETSEAPTRGLMEYYLREVLRDVFVDEDLEFKLVQDRDPESGFLAYVFDDEDELNTVIGTSLMRRFLEERVVTSGLYALRSFQEEEALTDKLESLAEQARMIQTAGTTDSAELPFTDEFFDALPEETPRQPTGVPYLDRALGGGEAPGECYCVMGATGAGKTTFAVSTAVSCARQSFAESCRTGAAPQLVLYYTYEENRDAQLRRFLSSGASIRRDRISISRDADHGIIRPVSTGMNNAYEYELRRWPNGITQFERERYNQFTQIANKTIRIRNFSGVPDLTDTPESAAVKRKMGCGGVMEILMDARRIQEQCGTTIRSIFIDYIGLLCMRQANYNNDEYYGRLKSIGDELRMKLAGELNCAVWVMHQLSGVANSYSPLRKPSLADGEGCKSLPVNMQLCLVLGVPDGAQRRGCGGPRLYCVAAKQRNAGCTDMRDGIILQHDEDFVRLNEVTSQFRPNPRLRGFERRGNDRAEML